MYLKLYGFFLSATMVGGAYISGTASEIATKGLVNTVAPIGYNLGLAIGNFEDFVFLCYFFIIYNISLINIQ